MLYFPPNQHFDNILKDNYKLGLGFILVLLSLSLDLNLTHFSSFVSNYLFNISVHIMQKTCAALGWARGMFSNSEMENVEK